ncbi:hypothetical protein F5Y04DRAFT_66649 [Hypomontagnella monticulosa]|nr:hypothetical protein F5Y04DRAFT_66649 [Hypomontagnella monticulosa]
MSQLPVRSSLSRADSDAKRRKIRKGTHSCWECRRRKTRCQFESATATVCIGCEARGTTCVSQEFPDEQPPTSDRGLSQRLSRVEGLLERLVEHIDPNSYSVGRVGGQPLNPSVSAEDDLDSSSDNIQRPSAAEHPPVISMFDALREENRMYTSSNASFVPTPSTQGEVVLKLPAKHAQISKAIHAAFPSQHDIDLILAGGASAFFIVTFFNGIDGPCDPPSSVGDVPPATSHPALLAKRLLQVTTCMQKMPTAKVPQDLNSKESFRSQMTRFVNLVSDLVASNDDLVGSVEGLETLNLIALYHANAGNLRKSWLALRRANSVAQLMGVDKWPDHKPMKSVDPRSDPATRSRASSIWYRTNFSDRYLSMLLGVSTANDDDNFADPSRTLHDAPTQRLEKIHTVMTGAIIKRNLDMHRAAARSGHATGPSDSLFGTTQAIDCSLEQAGKAMGSAWWEPVVVNLATASPAELVHAHAKVMTQMSHHHLLVLLHLPYMMRDPKERRWDYSKTTCMSSSRAVLRGYLVFRHLTDAAAACRHTDYGALTAAMTLLLGYLDPKLRARDPVATHQRAEDRELAITIRDMMKRMAEQDDDKLSRETSDIITRLLPLTDVDQTGSGREGMEAPVRLEIPYLGTININPVNRRSPHQPQPCGGVVTPLPTPYDHGEYDEEIHVGGAGMPEGGFATAQGLDNLPTDPSLQPPHYPPSTFLAAMGEDDNYAFMQFEPDLTSPYQFPELAADVDQWTFQGFDATFFESLFS